MTRTWLPLCMLVLLACGACAHRPRKQPRQRLPAQPTTAAVAVARSPSTPAPAGAPELIEVRILVVAHQGAQGAPPEQTRTREQALERAAMIARMARGGDKLGELVRSYSDREGAAEDLGLFRLRPAQPGAFGPEVAQAALALSPGQVSNPVHGSEGYFVIERRPDPLAGPARIGARHILISYRGAPQAMEGVTRGEAEARALAAQIARDAKSSSDRWSSLAAQYTDEPGSRETGGDLGHFGRGQMVPSFEKAAFGLSVGQVSDVVQTPFGFHVIQRYD